MTHFVLDKGREKETTVFRDLQAHGADAGGDSFDTDLGCVLAEGS